MCPLFWPGPCDICGYIFIGSLYIHSRRWYTEPPILDYAQTPFPTPVNTSLIFCDGNPSLGLCSVSIERTVRGIHAHVCSQRCQRATYIFFRFFFRSSVPDSPSMSVSSPFRFYNQHVSLSIRFLPSSVGQDYKHQSLHHHADHNDHSNHRPALTNSGQTTINISAP